MLSKWQSGEKSQSFLGHNDTVAYLIGEDEEDQNRPAAAEIVADRVHRETDGDIPKKTTHTFLFSAIFFSV